MAAQAPRDERLAAADVVLDNSGSKDELRDAVDRLWKFRLAPFAENLSRHRLAPRAGGPVLTPANPDWPAQAGRLIARLRAAAGEDILALDHVGSTAVPGLAAKDVLDLQLGVEDLAAAERIAPLLADAGFPSWPGVSPTTPSPRTRTRRTGGSGCTATRTPAGPSTSTSAPSGPRAGGLRSASGTGCATTRPPGPTTWPRSAASPSCTAWTNPPQATPPTRKAGSRTTPRRGWTRGPGARAGGRRRTPPPNPGPVQGPGRSQPGHRTVPAPVPPKAESGHPVAARR